MKLSDISSYVKIWTFSISSRRVRVPRRVPESPFIAVISH